METTKLDNGQDSIVWEQDLEFPYFINKNGQIGWIADFLDRFYRNVFDMNIKMLNNEKRREFPIAYCKTQAMPMFANAVGRLTPHCIGKASRSTKADLWCYVDERDEKGQEVEDVLVYLKTDTLNLNTKNSLNLHCSVKEYETKLHGFKIDIFNIRVCYHYNKEPENLFSSDFFDEKVWRRIKPPHGNFIYSVMDLRPSIHTRKATKSDNLNDIINKNPQQIFLKHGYNYISKADLSVVFLPFIISVAVIEDLRG